MDISNIASYGKDIIDKYLPMYMNWLAQKLVGHGDFEILSLAVVIIFILVVYIWFRNKS